MIVVATGGWSVAEWYPPGTEPRDRLRALAERLAGFEPLYAAGRLSCLRSPCRPTAGRVRALQRRPRTGGALALRERLGVAPRRP